MKFKNKSDVMINPKLIGDFPYVARASFFKEIGRLLVQWAHALKVDNGG